MGLAEGGGEWGDRRDIEGGRGREGGREGGWNINVFYDTY